MSISKILAVLVVVLGTALFVLNWPKKQPEEIHLPQKQEAAAVPAEYEELAAEDIEEPAIESPQAETAVPALLKPHSSDEHLPKEVDRMAQLFQPYPPLLPIVETVTYASKVAWLTGRAAYLGDYASHYQTSKHFISRSLKGEDYLSEKVSLGDRFNVFKQGKEIQFHLVLDLSRLKLWAYYYDVGQDERVLLKSYPVCVGRLDPKKSSGCLTPTGVFKVGNEVAVYKPGIVATWRNEKKDMISVFGVRWMPLKVEIANCSGSCKGLGLHGVPWRLHTETNEYVENRDCIGHYESGGCVRLLTEDIEELFAVVISKPCYVHIVKDFQEANLPGKEKI